MTPPPDFNPKGPLSPKGPALPDKSGGGVTPRDLIPPMPARIRENYAGEVMARIREEQAPQPRKVWDWIPQPRLALSLGTVLAATLAVLVLPVTPGWKAQRNGSTISSEKEESISDLMKEIETLEAVAEAEDLTAEELMQELQEMDQSELGQG